jgi:hypothetical protein
MSALPNVIYIGLQKTGSTFLRHYFWNHGEVYCDRHGIFFQTDQADITARGADAVRADYAALFAERPPRKCHIDMYEALGMGYVFRDRSTWDGQVFINPDCSLATGPARPEPDVLAGRIHAVLPNAKILITIRNQIGWLDSNYRHYFNHLPAGRTGFLDFLRTLEGKISLDVGHFDRLVDLYDRLFGAENVHVLPLEKIESSEQASFRALAAFLNISPLPYAAENKNLNRGQYIPNKRVSFFARLRGAHRDAPSAIPADLLDILRSTYSAGNIRLSQRIGAELSQMGYPV